MASGRLSQDQLEELAKTLTMLMDACDRGMTPNAIRECLLDGGISPDTAETWVECARALHELPPVEERPAVINPRYRKGTGRRPVAWSDCLWKPPA